MTSLNLQKTFKPIKLLLIAGIVLFNIQPTQAGIFSWLKALNTANKDLSKTELTSTLNQMSTMMTGTSEVIVSVNWPTYAGENYLRIYDPSNNILAEICMPSNCYNGANVSYSTTENLNCLTDGAGYYIVMYDSYGDGWNGTGANVTVTSGGATVINNSGAGANNGGVTQSFTVSGGGAACGPSEGPGNAICVSNNEIGGIVFEDNNADGTLDSGEAYFENVSVALFDDNGQVGATQTTDSNGEYLFTGLTNGQSYRVEFTVPNYFQESPNNTNSKSSVQVSQAGSCDNSLGIFSSEGYCDSSNPPLVISCYEDGNAVYGGTGNEGKSLVSFPYNSSGATPTGISEVAKIYQVGSVWGVAYQPTEERMFASALLKRHVGFGAQGEGGVYVMDFSSGTGSYMTSFNLDGLTPSNGGAIMDFGTVNRTGTDNQLPNSNVTNSWDIDAFGKIGKVGIGDLDLQPDGKKIWLVNLNQRALVSVDVSNPASYPGTTNQYPLSDMTGVPSCTNGVLRPWALAFKGDMGYVGCVCTGENGGTSADLKAYVLSFNPSNPTTLTTEIDFALDYTRELAVDFTYYGLSNSGDWMPWASNWGDTGFGNFPADEIAYAQPILGEIDFLDDGAMVLGFSDRFGFQMGAADYIPVSGSEEVTSVDAVGDIIKVCNVGGTWVMEGGSGCSENDSGGTSALTNDGPSGTGEFFYSDAFNDTGQAPTYNHNETFIGGLKVLKGKNELIAGHYDPIDGNGFAFDLGIIWHNTSTGARSDNFMIIESGPSSSKGNNLGSIEAVCAAAPIEIGNYVWEDTDADGIQDPSENGIAGVTVSFTNTNDAVLGTTTTDGDGKYVFSNANVTGGIKYNTAYKVKIDLSNVQSILPAVGSVSEANLGNGKNDSDGTLNGATVTATLTTGGSGETTYAVDFGFNDFVNTTEVVAFAIQPTCSDNSTNNDGYLQISSVTDGDKVNWVMGSDYLAAGGDSDYANATTIGALPFQFANGLTNPTGSQDYTIRVFNGSSSSFKDTTLTMNEQTCTTGCNCVENLYLNDTGLGEVHKFSVDPTDGTITEIGSPWLSGLNNPHGLGSDLNGNLYIGDHNQGPVFKLDCDGGTVADNTVIWNNTIIEGLTNLGSVGNYIITNGHTNSTSGKDLHVLDACSGDLIGTICLNNAGSGPWSSDWGLQVFSDGTILATDGQSFGPDNDRAIWKFQFDPSMINSSTCVDALVVNDYLSGMQDVVGITSDGTYLYVLTRDGSQNSTLLKIDATTGALVQSQYEGGWDGSGYNGALGLVYAPSSGYIYVSGYEDCIAIVDPSDLSYISPGNGTIPSGASPKAISILKECCPSSNNMVIDTFVTTASLNDSIFLQELINCSGTICQGVWSQGSNNTGLTYNACANTVRIDAADGCGTFTLSSDGLGKNPQCGAFNIVVNIKVIEEPSTVIGNRIWLDENSDGVQDAGEPGIPNVVVELQDGSCSSGTDCPITITDADGGYLFKNVPLGSYTVKVLSNVPSELNPIFDEDSGTSSPDMIASVIVTSDEYITADFGYNYVSKTDTDNPAMTATGALGNRIWNDVNADGIQDPGERGIPNITVNLLSDPDMDGVYTASGNTRTTDEYGNYIFDDIAAGAYALEVVEAGITNAGFTTTPTADPDSDANNISEPITIAPGDVWLGGDFGYTSSGTVADIGSTVFIDVDGDGVYDANNDLPLAGVTVALVKDVNTNGSWDAGEKAVATTLTDATGVYLFADLPADNYLVVVTDVNNVINDLTNSVDPDGGNNSSAQVTLSTTDQLTQNFGYVPTGHVAGNGFIGDMVFLDADASNGFTAGDAGIEGVEVELLNDGTSEVIASTATNENGMYYFGNLADGTYRVKVVSASIPSGLENNFDPDGSSPANNEGGAVIITSASSNLSQDFGYKAAMPHSIAGTIWEDSNAEGTLDGTETMRFEGVTIELKAADDNIIATTTTAIDGTYSFTQIPDGTYTVEVTDTRDSLLGMWHSLGSDSESDPIAITVSGADVTDVDFGYYQKGASLGNLVWEDMNGDGTQIASEPGIPGVLVTLTIDFNDDGTDDLSIASTTDTDGLYRFDNLLLDENDNGSVATYNISLTVPSGFAATRTNINMNSMDQIDSDDPAGVVAVTNQGETDMMRKIVGTLEPIAASYDFGLTRTTSLGNLVWLDENGDGVPDAGEPGIANVRMDLYDGTNTLIGSTTTDAKGGYLFTNLSSGDYTVKLVTSTLPTGLSHQTYDQDATVNNETALSVGSREVTIADFGYNYAPASDTDMPVVSDLGALGDRIWIDANSNGRQDAGEAGIENVTVELWTDVDADGVYTASGTTTTTDATGHYIFDDLEAQAYVVKVDETTLPAGFTAFPTGDPDHDADNVSEPIMLAPGDVYLNMDFGYNLPTGNTIGSMIYVDANGDGVLDAEPGVAGVTVSLENSNGLVIATTVTDETGYYNFPGLPNGSYTVVVNDVNNVLNNLNNSGDPDGITARESNVSLSGGDELSENFGFAPNEHTLTDGLIGSRVFLDTDGNNAFTSGEPGIENVMMSLVDVSTARVLSTTLTDENGHYYFGGLAAGDYEVVLDESTLPVGLTNSVDPNSTIPVNESGTVTLGTGVVNLAQNFGYKATAAHTVSGTIWEDINADGDISNESGTELAGVSLALYDTDGNLISTDETDTNGDYSFAGLPDGDYLIKVTDTKDSLMGYWHSLGTDSEPDLKSVTLSGNDLMDVDFGYYIMGAAVGNKVWLDYNGNHAQDLGEPGLPSTKLTLEIDYDDDGIADVSATAITGMDGSYSFRGLLLDEDHNGVGASPDYELIVTMPDADMSLAYATNIADLAGGNDKLDSDNHAGQVVMVYQGQENVANRVDASTETEAAAYDFGYTLDCASPSVDYAMTDDGSDPANANQTTDYFATTISGDTLQEHNPQTGLSGGIQSWTYCEVDGWNYYYNPLDPNEYLFAIDHGSNTTEIEYIEIRVDDNASDRHVANAADATFVMVRDWYVKTKDNAPLTANVNIRFYFPPNEYKQMLDAAKSQATAWGLSNEPTEAMVKWFKKPVFDPDNDIVAANTTLLPFDITNLRGSATDANGVNTALAAPAVENTRNHIQFNGITGFSGGTAMIHINRAALPVELSQFYGKSINCKETVITWTSETEESFSHYELERSDDGVRFEQIEKIEGTGDALLNKTYQYTDYTIEAKNYYRLKMVDLDGEIEYSKVIAVTTECDDFRDVKLYPNPVLAEENTVILEFYNNEPKTTISIVNSFGQVAKEVKLSDLQEWNKVSLDISDFPSGVYSILIAGRKSASQLIVLE